MGKQSILHSLIAISVGFYGWLSLAMPSVYSFSDICLGVSGNLFYLLSGLGFLYAGFYMLSWPRFSALGAAALFVPQILAFDTADYSFNFIGPIHVVFSHKASEFLILHINVLALMCFSMLLLVVVFSSRQAPSALSVRQ